MKRLLLLGAATALLTASAQDLAQLKKQIEAEYAKYAAAMAAKKPKEVESYMAPDFVLVTTEGIMYNRVQAINSYRLGITRMNNIRTTIKIEKIRMDKDRVICNTVEDTTCDIRQNDGKVRKYRRTAGIEETWRKIDGKWRIARTIEKRASTYIDGKLYDAKALKNLGK
ncbi:MAG: nuclear transport factor 2 family protein [Armatimonadetes bacterium]|nr:nuclear transport factor 2 family protein [Armatimonadota bacterium]